MRRILARSILAGTLIATLGAGTALGHECFIASRSDTGNVSAGTHSRVWLHVGSLPDLFGFIAEDPSVPALSDDQLAWAVEAASAAGLPNEFSIFVGTHTIAEGTPALEKHAANGKGVDHIEDWFPTVIDIYMEALTK